MPKTSATAFLPVGVSHFIETLSDGIGVGVRPSLHREALDVDPREGGDVHPSEEDADARWGNIHPN
jgi:hypothetical protein